MDAPSIAAGLASNPLAWIATILLVAVAYLFKELRSADKANLDRSSASDAAHRATLEKVLPLAEKLTNAVEILERLAQREGH